MIDHIDHIVLTTRDLKACVHFYAEVLGMRLEEFRTVATRGTPDERLTALQQQLRCGTDCGSCLPTLKRLVAAA